MAAQRPAVEAHGVRPVFVHMGPEDEGTARLFERYGVGDVSRVSDPDKVLYRAFGLERGRLGQLLGPSVIARGLRGLFKGHGVGKPVGDTRQLPGAFVVSNGEVVREFRHQTAADRPDYAELAR